MSESASASTKNPTSPLGPKALNHLGLTPGSDFNVEVFNDAHEGGEPQQNDGRRNREKRPAEETPAVRESAIGDCRSSRTQSSSLPRDPKAHLQQEETLLLATKITKLSTPLPKKEHIPHTPLNQVTPLPRTPEHRHKFYLGAYPLSRQHLRILSHQFWTRCTGGLLRRLIAHQSLRR
jgi:hypothetical protein